MIKSLKIFRIDKIKNRYNELLDNLPVSTKLTYLVVFSLMALTLVGIGGLIGISRMYIATKLIADQKLPAANLLSNIRGQTAIMLQATLEVSNRIQDTTAQKFFKKSLTQKEEAISSLKSAMVDFEKLDLTKDEKTAWKEFQEDVKSWLVADARANDIIKRLGDNTDGDIQNSLFGRFKIYIFDWIYELSKVNKSLPKLLDVTLKAGQQAREASNSTKLLLFIFMGVVYAFAVVFSLVLAFIIVNSITKPLKKMHQAIVMISEKNDFTLRADISGNDEAGQTAKAFNDFLSKVQQSLQNVLNSAAHIANLSTKASDTSHRVSEASKKQSESASAMATSIERLSSSFKMISSDMQNVIVRSNEAGETAITGSGMILKSKEEMDRIVDTMHDASKTIDDLCDFIKRISLVMQVIEDVADQTKLLSLNATIQAAHAGENGRSFAVVADEISKLAKRTRSSTTEISETIDVVQNAASNAVKKMETVMQQVSEGKLLSEQATGCMETIQDGSKRVTEAINEISSTITTLGTSTQEISILVENVVHMIEENTQSSDETANVSNELNNLSASLMASVDAFRIR